MTATATRPRLLTLLLILTACGVIVGCGTTAAGGPRPAPHTAHVDTSEQPAEPSGRAYLAAPAPPAPSAVPSAVPSTPAAPPAITTSAPAPVLSSPSVPPVAPSPAALSPQPVTVADPAPPVIADEDEGLQLPDEVIGSYRCEDPAAVVVAVDATGLVCQVRS